MQNHILNRDPYFLHKMLIMEPYIRQHAGPEPSHLVDKWESEEFECADEWSWCLPRTVIKHYVSSDVVIAPLFCQVRCSLARPNTRVSFQNKHRFNLLQAAEVLGKSSRHTQRFERNCWKVELILIKGMYPLMQVKIRFLWRKHLQMYLIGVAEQSEAVLYLYISFQIWILYTFLCILTNPNKTPVLS